MQASRILEQWTRESSKRIEDIKDSAYSIAEPRLQDYIINPKKRFHRVIRHLAQD